VPLIGKTGTTDGAKDTWVIVSSTQAATVVWVGNIIGDFSIRNYSHAGVSGGLLRHVIMKNTQAVINSKYGGAAFAEPAARLLTGSGVTVPDVTGQTPEQARPLLESLGFAYADGGQVDSELPAGKIAATSPGAGALTARGTTVTVYTSNGSKIQIPDVVTGNPGYGAAQGTLNAAGFNNVSQVCAVTADPSLVNKVVSQDPPAGTYAIPSTAVKLGIGQLVCP
jgi:membrane peptidoglycan carboxypeptidase